MKYVKLILSLGKLSKKSDFTHFVGRGGGGVSAGAKKSLFLCLDMIFKQF